MDFKLSSRHTRIGPLALMLFSTGCMSPTALDISVMSYDRVTSSLLSQQLLLNIARARHHEPIHFTAVSNIAATFNFQFSAGGSPALTGDSGGMIVPSFGGTVSENPTITIVPIEGEEFTKRLLTPVQENMVTMLLSQGADVDLLLRLLADEHRELRGREEFSYHNRPSDAGYSTFRRIALHLSSIQDRNVLHVEPLRFEQVLEFPAAEIKPEMLADLEKNYTVEFNPRKNTYRLIRITMGRVIITNYDPDILSNEERMKLNDWAQNSPANEINVDIRPGFVGGEMPVHGNFKLRSLAGVIEFIGRGISEDREYEVPKDKRTPNVSENPALSLAITESPFSPDVDTVDVSFKGMHYSVAPDQEYHWNQEGFALLHQIFQMTVTELPRAGIPSLTIAK